MYDMQTWEIEVVVYWRKNKNFSMRSRFICDDQFDAIDRAAREVSFMKAQGFNATVTIWKW